MASAEKFCLRWNDFESNISVAFRELREEKDFFDVTLACEDSQVSAHKVILSACSPFFRNVLRRNPHQHPLLYLKGVKYQEMLSVLNFMYMGEVNVAQEELNSFLAVAEELRVKGLTQNSSEASKKPREPAARDPAPPPKRPRPPQPAAVPVPVASRQTTFQEHSQEDELEIQEVTMPVKAEPREQLASYQQEGQESAVALEDGYQEEHYEEYEQYEYDGIDPNTGLPLADGNKESKIRSKMQKTPDGSLWLCADCGHTSSQAAGMRNHVESLHVGGVGYVCTHCNKYCRTKNALDTHRSRYKHF